jgi:hypothetical protein
MVCLNSNKKQNIILFCGYYKIKGYSINLYNIHKTLDKNILTIMSYIIAPVNINNNNSGP